MKEREEEREGADKETGATNETVARKWGRGGRKSGKTVQRERYSEDRDTKKRLYSRRNT